MTNSSQTRTSSVVAAPSQTSSVDSYELAMAIAKAADDRKGVNIVLLNVGEVSYLADYFVIVTGFSNVQVRAIARSVEDVIHDEFQRLPRQSEGVTDGGWVLLDYGDVIAHVFLPQEREFYNLEAFWGHAPRTPFSLAQVVGDSVH